MEQITQNLAHEINQPLNIMKIIAQSLLRDIKKDKLEIKDLGTDLEEIISQIDNVSELISKNRTE